MDTITAEQDSHEGSSNEQGGEALTNNSTEVAVSEDIELQNKDEAAAAKGDVDVVKNETPIADPESMLSWDNVKDKLRRVCKRICTVFILSVLIITVWLLFALPTVFYGLNHPNVSKVRSTIGNSSQTRCVSQTYTGSVCESELREWHQCFSGGGEAPGSLNDNEHVLIPSDIDQDPVEADARSLLELGLPFVNPSVECETAFKSFLCLYLFGLCDTDNTFHQALQEDCVRVRDEICPREWGIATELLQANPGLGSLPQCEDLSSEPSSCFQQDNLTDTDTSGFMGVIEPTNVTMCSEGFYLNRNSCRPECGKWAHPDFTSNNEVLERWIIITSVIIALLASVLFIVIAATCQRKVILVYPSTYLVYIMIVSFVLALMVLISAASKRTIFCHSRDLIETFENGASFCAITGFVYYYSLVQIAMWLLFHSGALFWGIVFPFHYRRWKHQERFKYVHITTVVLALLLPAISPITVLLKGGYVSITTPTYICLGRNSDVSYATLVLPISIFGAIASSLLIIIFWTILKQFVIKRISKKKAKIGVGKAQVKIMVILCYYILLGVFGLIVFTVAQATREANTALLRDYFLCESSGREECDTQTTSFLPVLGQLVVVTYFVQAMLPVVVLLFGLNTSKANVKNQLGSLRRSTLSSWRRSTSNSFQLPVSLRRKSSNLSFQ